MQKTGELQILYAMKFSPFVIGIIFLLACLSGCGLGKHVDEQSIPNSALVFGYVDMVGTSADLEWAEAKQVKPLDTQDPYKKFRVDGEGMFYLENLPLGSYRLTRFGGGGWKLFPRINTCFGTVDHYYNFPSDYPGFERLAFRLEKPGLYFAGSSKQQRTARNLLTADDNEFTKIDAPGERDLLKRLLLHTSGTKWNALVRKRIEELENAK
jgi:hypothetical protein